MAAEYPAATSSHQPFAQPQSAPINAASPPTRQSLKTWWKGFRPPAKTQEAPGNDPNSAISSAPLSLESEILHNQQGLFVEYLMGQTAPLINGTAQGFGSASSHKEQTGGGGSDPESIHSGTALLERPSKAKQRTSSYLSSSAKKINLRPCKRYKHTSFCQKPTSGILSDTSSFLPDAGSIPRAQSGPLSYIFDQVLHSPYHLRHVEQEINQSEIVEQPPRIFGVPLRTSIAYANVAISLIDDDGKSYIYGYVPIVVAKCGVFLKEKATNVAGIFRMSGSEKRINELKRLFDSPDRYGKGLDWEGFTVHDAANVLRRYLNELPEPIVPLELYDRFREPLRGHTKAAVGDNEGPQLDADFDANAAIATYQQLITELPPLNRQLLLYILDLLAVFASKADENLMGSQNLATIFQPGMLRHPQHDMSPPEYRLSQDVLIFLIENQDHFLIGMRGTAADEKTVNEVQSGAATPTTPAKTSNTIGRSASNASAGADSVRKFGGIRRNVSVSSRHSRQSNGAPSPATPTATGGIHRSNTVPSKRSPSIPQGRLQKNSGSPSPTTALVGTLPAQDSAPRGLSPAAAGLGSRRDKSPTSPAFPPSTLGTSSLAPSSIAATGTSEDRLLGDPEKQLEVATPSRERNLSSFFQRSPTGDSEKKQPNKLRKKRVPSSSNPSAQSSTHSLTQVRSDSVSPGLRPIRDNQDLALETIVSNPSLADNSTSAPAAAETPRAEQHTIPTRPAELHHSSDQTLKPKESPVSSLHSRSSFNDQSDLDHHDDTTAAAEHKEKRSRWRLSRRRERDEFHQLSPPKAFGSDAGAGASSSSIGSSARPRKSFTADTAPADTTLSGAQQQSSNDSGSAPSEDKKGPLGWLKNKMRREDKDAEKERTKSPPASTERLTSTPGRGKSVDIKREENVDRAAKEPTELQR
ncbi:hypothetical protein B0O99DRAFT_681805 [Bisporella sp. PMI_857]|nr:hypothetical protein B0O99DRAFT_681805 [Bisporella sp. PMI_857]